MDRFLGKFNLTRLKQEETKIMNKPITNTEIGTVIKKQNKTNKQKNLSQKAKVQARATTAS